MGLDSFLKVFLSQYLKKNIQVNQFFFHIRSLSVKQCSFVKKLDLLPDESLFPALKQVLAERSVFV